MINVHLRIKVWDDARTPLKPGVSPPLVLLLLLLFA